MAMNRLSGANRNLSIGTRRLPAAGCRPRHRIGRGTEPLCNYLPRRRGTDRPGSDRRGDRARRSAGTKNNSSPVATSRTLVPCSPGGRIPRRASLHRSSRPDHRHSTPGTRRQVEGPYPAWLRGGLDVPEGDGLTRAPAASARQQAPIREEEGVAEDVGGEVRPLGAAGRAHVPDLDPGTRDVVPGHHPRTVGRERNPGDVRQPRGGGATSSRRTRLIDPPDLRSAVFSAGDQHGA